MRIKHSFIGIGLLLGLLVGTLLYIIGGYFLPFIVYCILMLAVTPLSLFVIPKTLETEESKSINTQGTPNEIEINAKGIFKEI